MYNMENAIVERKIVNVTGKRQVTIPLKFCDKLGFGKEKEIGEITAGKRTGATSKDIFGED